MSRTYFLALACTVLGLTNLSSCADKILSQPSIYETDSRGKRIRVDPLSRVQKGMTIKEVENLLGSPKLRNFDHYGEHLQYHHYFVDMWRRIDITYVNGRVAELLSSPMANPMVKSQTPAIPGDNTIPTPIPAPGYPPIGGGGYYGYPDNPVYPPGYGRGEGYQHPEDEWFKEFLEGYKRQTFDSEKKSLLRQAARVGFFTVDQIVQLLRLETFDSERMQILQIVAPRIIDREVTFRILELFSFERDKAARIINDAPYDFGSFRHPYAYTSPREQRMRDQGDVWFSNFFADYKRQTFSSEKKALLRQASRTGFFTTDQVVQLLRLETFDSERIEILKMVAPRIIDRESSFRILELFSFNRDNVARIINDAPYDFGRYVPQRRPSPR